MNKNDLKLVGVLLIIISIFFIIINITKKEGNTAVVYYEDKEILKRFVLGAKTLTRKEIYQFAIYVKDLGNIIDYNTEDSETHKKLE